jgi:hypothetical protein
MARCMGLSRTFIESPGLPLVYVTHNRLAARVDMNVFDPHCLLTTASKLGQGFRLCGECAQKLHRQATTRIQLRNVLRSSCAPHKIHREGMCNYHLARQHRFNFILRPGAIHGSKNGIRHTR